LSVVVPLLKELPLKGNLVTGDALYCQRKVCAQIREANGDYLVIVKKNQETLYEDIELLFAEPPEGETFACAEERGRHGDRQEVRRLWASTALRDYLDWPGVQQVCKVERVTEQKGKQSQEVRYAITSLGEAVGADQVLKYIRGHWAIENRLHYVRDVTFGEDASQIRTGATPQVMAALRNTVLAILRQEGWSNIAAALRFNAWQADAALQLLGIRVPS
jgi:predicted transposase YbfD/YdcC